jgi:hypothetical protein
MQTTDYPAHDQVFQKQTIKLDRTLNFALKTFIQETHYNLENIVTGIDCLFPLTGHIDSQVIGCLHHGCTVVLVWAIAVLYQLVSCQLSVQRSLKMAACTLDFFKLVKQQDGRYDEVT